VKISEVIKNGGIRMEIIHNWMKSLAFILALVVVSFSLGCGGGGDDAPAPPPSLDQVSCSRNLPDSYTPGDTISVTIEVNVDESNNPNGFIIKDYVPSGWTIASSSPTYANFNSSTGEVKWVFYGSGVMDMEITYEVTIPPSAGGSRAFSGDVLYNDPQGSHITKTISGDATIIGV
jgi:hypothetical protein